MNYVYDDFNYTLRIEKGEQVMKTLLGFVREKNIKGAWVLGLGGLMWAELGFYDLNTQEYAWQKFDELLELTNLTGNIAWQDDKPVLHAHVTVSDASFHAHGGHLREAEAAGTVELFIHVWDDEQGLTRQKDDQTGLNLLQL